MLTITDRCNLKCTYCYESNREDKVMDIVTAKKIIQEYLNLDKLYSMVNIVLFGGEPFLYPNLVREICEWTWENDWNVPYIFNFSTNGTLLSKDIKAWLRENANRIIVNLSADGTKIAQNANRSNSFDLIDYNFFTDTWEKPMVKMTISNISILNLAENVIFFHEKGFGFLECNFAEGIEWNFNKKILEREFVKLAKYYESHPQIEVCPLFKFDLNLLLQKKETKKRCGIGNIILMYYVDGNRYPCNCISPMSMKKEQLEKLNGIDYNDGELLVDWDCKEYCDYFSLCPTCYASNYIQNGTLCEKNRRLCEVLKLRIYYAAIIKSMRMLKLDEIEKMNEEDRIYYQSEITAIKKILSDKM